MSVASAQRTLPQPGFGPLPSPAPGVHALVFDMDGLLLNTEHLARQALRLAGAELGIEFDEEVGAAMIGVPADESRRLMLARYGEHFPLDVFLAESARHLRAQIDGGGMHLQAGAQVLLEALLAAGMPCALATSSGREKALHHLERAGVLHCFDAVVTRDDVARGKPHPDLFLLAAQRLNRPPQSCLALEDSYNGVRAAHAAGMPVVMVPDLLPPTPEMREKALTVVPDLHAVHGMIAGDLARASRAQTRQDAAPCPSIRREGGAPPLPANVLVSLAADLRERGYRFITPTPETQRRFLEKREGATATTLRDAFGWNLPFEQALLAPHAHAALAEAGLIVQDQGLWRSRLRFASLGDDVYLHSGYPTTESDAVFFGPDTYRFVSLVTQEIARFQGTVARVVDVGCGGGAGGLMAANRLARLGRTAPSVELVDINRRALDMAAINARSLQVPGVQLRVADLYAGTHPGVDLIIANPPYLLDPEQRLYRHGGGEFGFDLSRRIVDEGVPLLAPGGALVLYTGSPIVDGCDLFLEAIQPWLNAAGHSTRYWEMDPDVFGEELDHPAYREVERIAVVALVIRRDAEDG